jgi:hypothetical protein
MPLRDDMLEGKEVDGETFIIKTPCNFAEVSTVIAEVFAELIGNNDVKDPSG